MNRVINRKLLRAAICVVFFGFLTARGYAQIGGPPIIVVQPLGVAVQNGGTAILTTTFTSVSSVKYFHWFFNDQPLSNTNATVVNVVVPLVGTVSTLTISNVSPSWDGNYSVRITNGVGSAVSSNATLVVLSATVSNVVSIASAGLGLTTSGFNFQLTGPVGSNVVVEASSDLVHWTPIATNYISSGAAIPFNDPAATNYSFRYYRAHTQ